MKRILVLLCLVLCCQANSQDHYRIVFDYISGNSSFFRIDKNNHIVDTLKKPSFRRKSHIELQVKNVNPFALDVQLAFKEENLQNVKDMMTFTSVLGTLKNFSGDKLKLNVPNLPVNQESSRGAAFVSKFSEYNDLTVQVEALKTSVMALLLNPALTKTEIQQKILLTAAAFQDARLTDPMVNFYLFLGNLEKVLQTDKTALNQESAMLLNSEREKVSDQPASRGEIARQVTSEKELQSMNILLQESFLQSVSSLNSIKSFYMMLESAPFDRSYDYEINSDKVNIELSFVQGKFARENTPESAAAVIQKREIGITATGGFKINTGVALTVNNFSGNSFDYYIDQNGTVRADPNDTFVPNLSTLINFYPVLSENFSIGGSFGVSIPLSDSVKGVNFLLGPSVFIGGRSRLSLSGGLAYGPVSSLTRGVQIGDTVTMTDVQAFTRTQYDFGYYFGLSFSLFDLK